MTDWLSEVLDPIFDRYLDAERGVIWEISSDIEADIPKAEAEIAQEKAQAHKLISAQLIREQIKMLEKVSSDRDGEVWVSNGESIIDDVSLEDYIADLTNQLKKIEHEN